MAPLDWSLWVSLGNVYVEQKEYADALSAYKRAAEMNPSVPEPWLRQGDANVAKENWQAAAAAYEHAQMLRPNQPDALLRLAGLYEERDDLSKARRYARQATEVDPVSAAGYVILGRILSEKGKSERAADAFLTAVQLDPRQLAVYDRWMWSHTDIERVPYNLNKGRLETALANLAKSDESKTLWGQVLLGLGYLNLEEDTDQAIGHLEEASRMDPAFAGLYQELAQAYEETQDGRRAVESWQRYLYAATGSADTTEAQEHIDSLLQVQIEQPADGDRVSGLVKIKGTARGKEFKAYQVKYRSAGSPDTWSTIDTGTSPVEHGVLVTWETAGLAPGEYRLRLSVEDDDGKDLPYDEITVEIEPSN